VTSNAHIRQQVIAAVWAPRLTVIDAVRCDDVDSCFMRLLKLKAAPNFGLADASRSRSLEGGIDQQREAYLISVQISAVWKSTLVAREMVESDCMGFRAVVAGSNIETQSWHGQMIV
jgi:hypothetical protein